jgi:hypothetical protein
VLTRFGLLLTAVRDDFRQTSFRRRLSERKSKRNEVPLEAQITPKRPDL